MREVLKLRHAPTDTGAEFFEKQPIMERDEIEACEDFAQLSDLADEYACTVIRIETCLRFPSDVEDRDWFHRARSALILFKIAHGRLERRLKRLGRQRAPAIEGVAPEITVVGGV